MHDACVAHLDLKPENILIDRETKKIGICDFGLSCVLSYEEVYSKVRMNPRGTGEYRAPEVTSLYYCPLAADIYSLGCLLFVVATGYFPKISDTGSLIIPKALSLDPLCKDLLSRMCATTPEERPTAKEILTDPYFGSNKQL